jgi:cytochrome P450
VSGVGFVTWRQQTQEPYDTLEQVLANVDPNTWSEATVLQLRDEFKSFILAGHETSASMMTWCV